MSMSQTATKKGDKIDMTDLHYEFTGETKEVFGITLHRIRATRDLPHFGVKTGDVGGWVEHTGNLQGNAWVADEAKVFGNAKVYQNALVSDNARAYEDAEVYGSARVYEDARVYWGAVVSGDARVFGGAWVYGDAKVGGHAQVYGDALVFDNAWVLSTARVFGGAWVYGDAKVGGYARVFGGAWVYGDAKVGGHAQVYGDARIVRDYDYLYTITCTSRRFNLTLTRQKDGKHLIVMGCWEGTIDEFDVLIAKPRWLETDYVGADEARPEMEILASLMRARIERWK